MKTCRQCYDATYTFGHPRLKVWLRLNQNPMTDYWRMKHKKWVSRDKGYADTYRFSRELVRSACRAIEEEEWSRARPRYSAPWIYATFGKLHQRNQSLDRLAVMLCVGRAWMNGNGRPPSCHAKTKGHVQASIAAHLLNAAHHRGFCSLVWNRRKVAAIFTSMRLGLDLLDDCMSHQYARIDKKVIEGNKQRGEGHNGLENRPLLFPWRFRGTRRLSFASKRLNRAEHSALSDGWV